MPIYDVSVALSADTPTYPGDPSIEISQFLSLANGDPANVSLIHFGAHSGTHVDAPAHFLPGGARVNSLSLETLIGRVQVVEGVKSGDRVVVKGAYELSKLESDVLEKTKLDIQPTPEPPDPEEEDEK